MDEFAKKFDMKMQMNFFFIQFVLKIYKITHMHNEMWGFYQHVNVIEIGLEFERLVEDMHSQKWARILYICFE